MSNKDSEPDMKLFWGCFIALITTAFAFITRAFLVNAEPFWPSTFGLDQVQAQELFGAGIWPFAISIIVFSLIIDNIGYRAAMVFSFICYARLRLSRVPSLRHCHGRRTSRGGVEKLPKASLTTACIGVLLFLALETEPWRLLLTQWLRPCSKRTKPSGSTFCTLDGRVVW